MTPPSDPCPSEDALDAFVEGRLRAEEHAALHRHVDGCPGCRALVAEFARAFLRDAAPGDPPAGALEETRSGAFLPPGAPAEIDEYRLLRPLGRGAMGQVYLARDTVLDRLVAIKWIASIEPEEAARARFLLEARAIARLQHPNVAAIYRVGQIDGRPYLVSEYVRGVGLDRLERPLPWEQVLGIALGLSRGLQAAHRRGVLHRDIKPANAILAEGGEVKLLDFGLAKLLRPAARPATGGDAQPPLSRMEASHGAGAAPPSDLSASGGIVGTPRYIAPEVWRGEPATGRADLYSLGVVLYELCTGQPPHLQRTMDDLRQAVIERDATPVAERRPGIEPRLAALIDRCLRRRPEERPASGEELAQALEVLAQPDRVLLPGGNPYRGLAAFEAEHRAFFFGRGLEIRAVIELLLGEPVVVVAGDSGVGKSSLCRAGVLPLCQEGGMSAGRTWSIVRLVPGRRPLGALGDALAPFLGRGADEITCLLRARPAAIDDLLRARLSSGEGVLLFIDQMEELLTQGDAAEAAVVAEVLGQLAALRPGVRVLLTVRSDFLSRLAALPGVGGELVRGLYLLRPLNAEGLREAIVGPARRRGVAFESPELVEELVRATLRAEGGLPLLEFALAELWEARDEQRRLLPASALRAIGGVEGALARHADGVLRRLLPAERATARQLLCRLVTMEGLRSRRTEAELFDASGPAAPAARAALEALVRGRLLMAREAEGATYEIAHEALVTGWGTLRGWLAGDAERRVLLSRIERAAAEWERLGRSPELLWSPRQLAEAAGVDAADLSPRERAFVLASHRAARRRRLWQRALLGGAPLLFALSYGAMSLKESWQLERKVGTQLDLARASLAEARSQGAAAEDLRRKAFDHFDHRERELGEDAWERAQVPAAEVQRAQGRASMALEAALALDPRRRDVRDLFGAALYEQARWAERERQPAQRDELLSRLALYDPDGARRRLWDAPATLRIDTEPPGAIVAAARFAADPRHRLHLLPARGLGRTPLSQVKLDQGSYVLTLSAPGRAPVRYPVLLGRAEQVDLSIEVPAGTAVPGDLVYVPQGRFLFGSVADDTARRGFLNTDPLHEVHTGPFLIARHETTFAEWIAYLHALPGEERARRLPRTGTLRSHGALELRELPGQLFELTFQASTHVYHARAGEKLHYLGRGRNQVQDWLRLPVSGISCEDAEAYAEWLDRSDLVPGARLCTEYEWERAARGADDREFPHGYGLDPDDANYDETYGKEPLAFGPDEVGSHPASRSPFGLDDLTGNVLEWVTSSISRKRCVTRGGAYYYGRSSNRINNRTEPEPSFRDATQGVRICATYPAPPHP